MADDPPPPPMMPPEPVAPLRLMTWNIHGGIGPDGRFDLERIAALVARHDPDILALQEVDTRGRDPACLAPLMALRAAAAGHSARAQTITAPDGEYGHALFSRWPIRESRLHDLSWRSREPRVAIEALIETGRGSMRVVVAHLGLNLAERRRQAVLLDALAIPSDAVPTVLMGDLNDWLGWGAVRRRLARRLPQRSRIATFPACLPLARLDRIYVGRPARMTAVWTDPAAEACSDHLPVIAEVWPGGGLSRDGAGPR